MSAEQPLEDDLSDGVQVGGFAYLVSFGASQLFRRGPAFRVGRAPHCKCIVLFYNAVKIKEQQHFRRLRVNKDIVRLDVQMQEPRFMIIPDDLGQRLHMAQELVQGGLFHLRIGLSVHDRHIDVGRPIRIKDILNVACRVHQALGAPDVLLKVIALAEPVQSGLILFAFAGIRLKTPVGTARNVQTHRVVFL